MSSAPDGELMAALAGYEAARAAFQPLTDRLTDHLIAGELPTDGEIRAEEQARTLVVTARRRVLAAFAARSPEGYSDEVRCDAASTEAASSRAYFDSATAR
jgi:hypothetical protein